MKQLIRKILQEAKQKAEYSPGGKPVKVGRYVYHASNPYYRKKIQKQGLKPTVSDSYESHAMSWYEEDGAISKKHLPPAIFATNSENKKDWFDSPYDDDIYRIDTQGLPNEWFTDRHFDWDKKNKHVVTFQPIPLSHITLIYQGTGNPKD